MISVNMPAGTLEAMRNNVMDQNVAAYLIECVRLRQWFEANQRILTGMGANIAAEKRLPSYWSEQMRDAMKGNHDSKQEITDSPLKVGDLVNVPGWSLEPGKVVEFLSVTSYGNALVRVEFRNKLHAVYPIDYIVKVQDT